MTEPSVTLSMAHNSAMEIDSDLYLGTEYQSVFGATPVTEVRSTIEVNLDCPAGTPWATIVVMEVG